MLACGAALFKPKQARQSVVYTRVRALHTFRLIAAKGKTDTHSGKDSNGSHSCPRPAAPLKALKMLKLLRIASSICFDSMVVGLRLVRIWPLPIGQVEQAAVLTLCWC